MYCLEQHLSISSALFGSLVRFGSTIARDTKVNQSACFERVGECTVRYGNSSRILLRILLRGAFRVRIAFT